MIVLVEGEHFALVTYDDDADRCTTKPFNPWVEEILAGSAPCILQLEDGRTLYPAREEPCGHA